MEEEKKQAKIGISSILLIIAIIVIAIMSYYIYVLKTNYNAEVTGLETNVTSMQNTINNLQSKLNLISEIINSDSVPELKPVNSGEVSGEGNATNLDNTQTSNTETSNTENNAMYTFTSVDTAAVQGNPKILNIFELNENEMQFDYNSGFDFSKSTIDRQITGTAKINADQMYEYEEVTDGHLYKLVFEFDETDTMIKISEYDNGVLFGWINVVR